MSELTVEWTKGETPEFGRIVRVELPDKSKIYVSKKGWTLVTPANVETLLPWNEVELALDMSEIYFTGKELEKENACLPKGGIKTTIAGREARIMCAMGGETTATELCVKSQDEGAKRLPLLAGNNKSHTGTHKSVSVEGVEPKPKKDGDGG